MDIDIRRWHEHAAWTHSVNMNIDMQYGHGQLDCSIDMDNWTYSVDRTYVQHGDGQLDVKHGYRHAV
jgi:hypothetical protein